MGRRSIQARRLRPIMLVGDTCLQTRPGSTDSWHRGTASLCRFLRSAVQSCGPSTRRETFLWERIAGTFAVHTLCTMPVPAGLGARRTPVQDRARAGAKDHTDPASKSLALTCGFLSVTSRLFLSFLTRVSLVAEKRSRKQRWL